MKNVVKSTKVKLSVKRSCINGTNLAKNIYNGLKSAGGKIYNGARWLAGKIWK
ncbi:hypothetical protein MBCUT_00170 [Methanobrevibacter cuticularis]|uniref:Uncharacterized protein n=1 Tax=Methanobrevibacter cuticularis TaxID=47311 RepID=A0A166FLQ3_9EURY|nr:hypothetical protein [Methanobrevibacter cuticularis]KZX17806.1 hypothetical protein MBCUT_00170 [Methanobrevibacter cuticularis]